MTDEGHKELREAIGDVHDKMERRDARMDKKLDKILDNQANFRERVSNAEITSRAHAETCRKHQQTVVEPLVARVGSNSRAIQKAYGAIALIPLLFGGAKVAAALGWLG